MITSKNYPLMLY